MLNNLSYSIQAFSYTILLENMETTTPAFSLAIVILSVLIGLTGFGVYLSFGPPAKKLEEPWDRQED